MLRIAVFIKDPVFREKLVEIIKGYIMINAWDIEITVQEDVIEKFLTNCSKEALSSSLYFFDLDAVDTLSEQLDLLIKVRKQDPHGYIVCMGEDDSNLDKIIKHHIEPLDFILKSGLEIDAKQYYGCLESYYLRQFDGEDTEREPVYLKTLDQVIFLHPAQVLFFETSDRSRKIKCHFIENKEEKIIEFTGKLKDIETWSRHFFRTHRSYVVNLNYIHSYQEENKLIKLVNDVWIPISYKNLGHLKNSFDDRDIL